MTVDDLMRSDLSLIVTKDDTAPTESLEDGLVTDPDVFDGEDWEKHHAGGRGRLRPVRVARRLLWIAASRARRSKVLTVPRPSGEVSAERPFSQAIRAHAGVVPGQSHVRADVCDGKTEMKDELI